MIISLASKTIYDSITIMAFISQHYRRNLRLRNNKDYPISSIEHKNITGNYERILCLQI